MSAIARNTFTEAIVVSDKLSRGEKVDWMESISNVAVASFIDFGVDEFAGNLMSNKAKTPVFKRSKNKVSPKLPDTLSINKKAVSDFSFLGGARFGFALVGNVVSYGLVNTPYKFVQRKEMPACSFLS